MKIFKHRNIMGLIYGLILAIPMLSILVRSAYVVVNKNAKDNYSGRNQVSETVNYPSTLYANQEYTIDKSADELLDNMPNTRVQILDCYSSRTDAANWINERKDTIYYIRFLVNAQNNTEAYFYDESNTQIDYWTFYIYTSFHLRFLCLADSTYANTNDTLYYYEYNNNAYLDNAFDYSLSEYVSENSFGNLNFFEWWSNLFLDLNNPKSALYIHFVNWYMNYVLFVSSSYILFMVLMWFINYSRRLMERGLNYDW